MYDQLYRNPYMMYQQPVYQPNSYRPQSVVGLQGKVVDNVDVVKATDIPLDGSISYFPLVDGSAIISKQLQQDGTSKMIMFKPVEMNEPSKIQFVTMEDVEKRIGNIELPNIKSLQDDIKTIKKQIRVLLDKEE